MKGEPPQPVIHLLRAETKPPIHSEVIAACSKNIPAAQIVEVPPHNAKICECCEIQIRNLPRYLKLFQFATAT